MNLFGRRNPKADGGGGGSSGGGGNASSTTAAIAKLRDATETLEKREEHLTRKIDNEINQAKKFSGAGKKREALTCIKRKKMYEQQLEQLAGAKMTLQTQQLALENMNITKETLEVRSPAARAVRDGAGRGAVRTRATVSQLTRPPAPSPGGRHNARAPQRCSRRPRRWAASRRWRTRWTR